MDQDSGAQGIAGIGDDRLLLRMEEVARLLSISRSALYVLIAKQQLPSILIGRSRRVPKDQLKAWIEEQVG
jgi:excisionase family DNA binding protein